MATNLLEKGMYTGKFSVELWRNPKLNIVSQTSAIIKGNMIFVENGTAAQVMGGLQFYANNKPFTWGYKFIKKVSDKDGKVLWENWDKKE